MESKNSELYEDAASKFESAIQEINQKDLNTQNKKNTLNEDNNDNLNLYFKSGDIIQESINNNKKSEYNSTKFDNNEENNSCCQINKCELF